jgi:membrane-bound inhibitor of C-type lysozyme
MRFLPLLALCALAACQPESEAGPDDAGVIDSTADLDSAEAGFGLSFPHGPHRYVCTGGRAFEASFPVPDSVRLSLEDGRTLALGSVLSGSGARYSDGATTAWFRGMDDGFVEEGDSITYADCRRAD